MKPLKVSMQAFGPYNEMRICDFSDLGNSGIFLITGPTGSGKTSILDAICFALYGQATGALRSFRDMRNSASDDDTDTVARFEFSLGERIFKFERSAHIHKKRTGSISEIVNGECHELINGEWQLIVSGAENITKKATELLGFDRDQFSQVVVLPQGEFRKLLVASSKEKLQILQTLFSTGIWQKIIDEFSLRTRALDAELKGNLENKKGILDSVGCKSEDELQLKITHNADELKSAEEQLEKSDVSLQTAQDKYNQSASLNEKFSELENQRANLEFYKKNEAEMAVRKIEFEKLSKIRDFYPVIERQKSDEAELKASETAMKSAAESLEAAMQGLDAAKIDAEKADKKRADQAQLSEQLAKFNILVPDCKRLSDLLNKVESLAKQEEDFNTDLASKRSEQQHFSERISNGEKQTTDIYETYIKPLAGIIDEQNRITRMLDKFDRLNTANEQLDTLKKELDTAEKALKSAETELSAAKQESDRISQIISQNTAYSLACTLEEGEKCPVCGSAHHPSPATAPDVGEINREITDRILAECTENVATKKSAYDSKNALVLQKSDEVKSLTDECDKFEADQKSTRKRAAELVVIIENSNKQKAQYEKYSSALVSLKKQEQAAKQAADDTELQLKNIRNELSATNAAINEIKTRIPDGTDYRSIEALAQQKSAELKAITDEITKAEENKKMAETVIVAAKTENENAVKNYNSVKARVESGKSAITKKLESLGLEAETDTKSLVRDADWFDAEDKLLSEYADNVSRTNHRINELSIALKDKTKADMTEVEAALNSAKQQNSELTELVGRLKSQCQQLDEVCRKIEHNSKQTAKKEAEYGKMLRIQRLISGYNTLKTPINNFVLGLTLDDVVCAATRYLTEFSKGRYSLIRVDEASGSGFHGLDIQVKDAHTGAARKVSTLSGGEMFLASLSLALGLAEVVQSYSGGIMLDSIFIDEGFGSLDSDTLDLAMSALEQIRREGRTVGIISHVPELKERIGARIEIKPGENGARIEVRHLF